MKNIAPTTPVRYNLIKTIKAPKVVFDLRKKTSKVIYRQEYYATCDLCQFLSPNFRTRKEAKDALHRHQKAKCKVSAIGRWIAPE